MAGETIKLQSKEGEIFEVDIAIIAQSEVLKGFSPSEEDPIIPVPAINSAILRKVIEWATYHKNDPPRSDDAESVNDISPWDQNFLKVDHGTLFELVSAANYLDMKDLLDVTCKTIATMIKGRAPSEIRRLFNIKTNFTPAEEEQISKEEAWTEEN